MALAGYKTRVYITGTSTSFTGEAFTNTTGNTWQIDATAKRVWNPSTIPTFYDNAVAISSNDISSIDYLLGTVTFTGVKVGPITADGAYLPLLQITGAYEGSLSVERELVDATLFSDTSHVRLAALLTGTFSVTLHDKVDTDLDPGGGTRKLSDVLSNGTSVVVSFRPDSTTNDVFRMWCIVESLETSAAVDDQVDTSVSFTLSSVADSAGRPAYFSYGEG